MTKSGPSPVLWVVSVIEEASATLCLRRQKEIIKCRSAAAERSVIMLLKTVRVHKKTALITLAVVLAASLICGFVLFPGREAPVSAEGAAGTNLPILMYHHCLEEERLGKWVISVSEFENDLKYIQAQGYTTIVVQDLLDHYQKGTPLPEKPIMITIDDGHLSTYTYLYPLLKQYNMKAVLSIVGAYTDEYTETTDTTVSYAYLSWDNVKELSDSGVIEIQNHSYNMHSTKNGHNGISRMGGESDEAYKKRFMEDIGGLQTAIQEHTGRTPTAFTYPFGYINEDSKPYIKELGFQVVFTCEERVNRLPEKADDILTLMRFNRPHGRPVEDFFQYIYSQEPRMATF